MVANLSDALGALRTHFAGAWTTTPIAWDNVPYEPAVGTSYVGVMVQPIRTEPVSCGVPGQRRVRTRFALSVDVATPVDKGDGPNTMLCDAVAAVFRFVTLDGVVLSTPEVIRVGPIGAWFIQRVRVPGYFDTFS